MKINYYLDKQNPDNKGECRIFMSAHYFGRRLRVYTRMKTPLKDWDDRAQRMKDGSGGAVLTNAVLESYRRELLDVYIQANLDRIDPTIEFMKDNLTFLRGLGMDFFKAWDQCIEEQASNSGWTDGTLRRFATARNHLARFNQKYKLEFGSIDEPLLQKYLQYHIDEGLSNTFAEKNIKILKWFMSWATRKGYNSNIRYQNYRRRLKKPLGDENFFYLFPDELKHIICMKMTKPSLEMVRDIFCFSCFTGLKYNELAKLRKKDIDGDLILINRGPRSIQVPLTKFARALLNRYQDEPGQQAFPVISNQRFNQHLKDLGRKAGLNRRISRISYTGDTRFKSSQPLWTLMTSKFARKTFITTGIYTGIPLATMLSLTGQSVEVIKKFYAISDKLIETERNKFEEAIRVLQQNK
jgi:site-specific recombinase XerD